MSTQERQSPDRLYDPHDFDPAPEPDFLKEYEIEDVNPKWFKDILGPWEFYRSPDEICLSADDKDNSIHTVFSFRSKLTHIFSVSTDIGQGADKPEPAIEVPGRAKIRFSDPRMPGEKNMFTVITEGWEALVTMHEKGKYIRIQNIPLDSSNPIYRMTFENPKPPQE